MSYGHLAMTSPRLVYSLSETINLAIAYMAGTPCDSLVALTTEGYFRINADGTYVAMTIHEAEWIEANA